MEELQTLAKNVKNIREKLGETQSEFALNCGLTPNEICCIENQQTNPTLGTIQNIASYAGVTVIDLLKEQEENYFLNRQHIALNSCRSVDRINSQFVKRSRIMRAVIKRTIGGIIKKKRLEYGISQEKMAEKCCISLRQYSDIEHCLRLPNLENFIKIVIKCGFSANDIISMLLKNGYEVTDDDNAA